MHNSESWVHRSLVAVAREVTRVVQHRKVKIHTFIWMQQQKKKKRIWTKVHRSTSSRFSNAALIFSWETLSVESASWEKAHWCVKKRRQPKSGYYIVGQWKLHLYWVDPLWPSNILWPHTSAPAYKWHSRERMDGSCSYTRSLVSKAC